MAQRTLVRHEPDDGQREIVVGCPAPQLHAQVSGYCGYHESASAPTRRLEVPSGRVGLIVGLGPRVAVTYPRQRADRAALVRSFVAGLHDSCAVVESTDWQRGVQVDLTPMGAHMLLGVPMDALANRVIELEEILGGLAARLAEQLDDAASWEDRFDLLDAVLARRLAGAREPSPAVTWAWRRLRETGGRLRIGALANELGSSRQYLVSRFREEVGLPPKTLARIFRFEGALRLLERDGEPRLAAIAHQCGYYDQAHLNRDFRELSGGTPTEYLARRLPDGAGVAWS